MLAVIGLSVRVEANNNKMSVKVKTLQDLTQIQYAQCERLAFIDYCLEYIGKVSRKSLVKHFNVGPASCSRDFRLYHSLVPGNTTFQHSDKSYYRSKSFSPLFEHEPSRVLFSLMHGFGDGFSTQNAYGGGLSESVEFIFPNPETMGALTRAITGEFEVELNYWSLRSGRSKRLIAPHSVVNNGQHWLVRAFDYKTKHFKDFVCKRIESLRVLESQISNDAGKERDEEWTRTVTLELVPHPKLKHSKPIEMELDMSKGKREIQIRAALTGYLLQFWNVDCSFDASLDAEQYHIWLKNSKDINFKIDME